MSGGEAASNRIFTRSARRGPRPRTPPAGPVRAGVPPIVAVLVDEAGRRGTGLRSVARRVGEQLKPRVEYEGLATMFSRADPVWPIDRRTGDSRRPLGRRDTRSASIGVGRRAGRRRNCRLFCNLAVVESEENKYQPQGLR